MSVHRLPSNPTPVLFHVYAIFCRKPNDPAGFVKFGYSGDIGRRLSQIRVACPIPVKMMAVVDVDEKWKALKLEKAFFTAFAHRHSTGEWYEFDFSSKEDKKEFNEQSQLAIINNIGMGRYWTKISIEALDAREKERRGNLLRNRNLLKKLNNQKIAIEQQKKNWQKLNTKFSSI